MASRRGVAAAGRPRENRQAQPPVPSGTRLSASS